MKKIKVSLSHDELKNMKVTMIVQTLDKDAHNEALEELIILACKAIGVSCGKSDKDMFFLVKGFLCKNQDQEI